MTLSTYLKDLIVKKALKLDKGRVKMFHKIDYIMFPASGMSEMLQKIGEDKGEKYLFDLGYKAGTDGADEMLDVLGLVSKSIPQNLSIIFKMFETLGFGKMVFKIFQAKQGRTLLNLTNNPVIDYAKIHFKNKSLVCAHYMGIFSVHGEKDLRITDCMFRETQCVCKGDDFCEWSTGIFPRDGPILKPIKNSNNQKTINQKPKKQQNISKKPVKKT